MTRHQSHPQLQESSRSRHPGNLRSDHPHHPHHRHRERESNATATTLASTTTSSTIRVKAPATLSEGYQFDVMLPHLNQPYTVTVPRGGIEEGQEFEIPLFPADDEPDHPFENKNNDEYQYPAVTAASEEEEGHADDIESDSQNGSHTEKAKKKPPEKWRRSLCGCCGVLTQGTFWMGFICAPILIGQLLMRLGLDWRGHENSSLNERAMTFNRIVLSAIAVLLLGYIPGIGAVLLLMYWLLVVVYAGTNLRTAVRKMDRIPVSFCPRCCGGRMADGVCMLLCGCCSAIQMARQTHNDLEYPGYCCTITGLSLDAPSIDIAYGSSETFIE